MGLRFWTPARKNEERTVSRAIAARESDNGGQKVAGQAKKAAAATKKLKGGKLKGVSDWD